MKKLLIGILIGMLVSIPIYSIANTASLIGKKVETEVNVSLNGEVLATKGIAIEGTSYMPVRAISEALGLNVNYNSEKREVELRTAEENTSMVYSLEEIELQISRIKLNIIDYKYTIENSKDQSLVEKAEQLLQQAEKDLAKWEAMKEELLKNNP